jgi:uncharacterized membrane protein
MTFSAPEAAAADDAAPHAAPPPVRRARGLVAATLALLVALCLAWELVLAPTGRGTWAMKVLPLVLCAPGLWRHRLYTYRWLSLLVWLYVTEGLVRATSEGGLSQWLAAAEVALATALFVLCVHYIRLRLPRRPRSSSPAPAPAASEP